MENDFKIIAIDVLKVNLIYRQTISIYRFLPIDTCSTRDCFGVASQRQRWVALFSVGRAALKKLIQEKTAVGIFFCYIEHTLFAPHEIASALPRNDSVRYFDLFCIYHRFNYLFNA